MNAEKRKEFCTELEKLVNRYGVNAFVGLPDFAISRFLLAEIIKLKEVFKDGGEKTY